MSNGAKVGSVEAVGGLRLHLKRLGHDLEEALLAADAEALRAHAEIEEAIDRARAEVQRCQNEVARSRAELSACRASGPDEHGRPPNCDDEEEALDEAEERLNGLVGTRRQLEDASEEYGRRAHALRHCLECDLSRADAFLATKLAALEAYLAAAPPPGPADVGGLRGPALAASGSLSSASDVSPGSLAARPSTSSTAADYRRLRSRTPSPEIRRLVNPPGPKFDPVYKHPVPRLDADHIVPVKEIVGMPGFAGLPDDRKVAVLNLPANILGVSREVNASRGDRTWAEYEGHPRLGPVPPQVKEEMMEKDRQAREAIRRAIDGASQT